jgi:putative nucleotidyltransferase with HDIG domain
MKHFGRRLHDRIVIPLALAAVAVSAVTALLLVALVTLVASRPGDPGVFLVAVQLAVGWSVVMAGLLVGLALRQRGRTTDHLRAFTEGASRAAAGEGDGVVHVLDPELAQLADAVARMGDALRERTDTLSRKVVEISTLREVGRTAGRAGQLEAALDAVLDAAVRTVPADRAYVVLVSPDGGTPVVAASRTSMPPPGASGSGSAPAAWVIANGRPLVLGPGSAGSGAGYLADPLAGAVSAVAVPVLGSEDVLGVLVLGSTDASHGYSADHVRSLGAISDQAALAVQNVRLSANLQESYLATVRSLAAAIEARDAYTRGHSDRVAAHALAAAHELGLSGEQQMALEIASYLHDIGKIGIPEAILGKPGRLDADEFSRMKEHVTIGAGILGQVAFPWPVAPIVRHHHERWDGRGYPGGLSGEDIPLLARIVTVADSYEAMTSDRPYRGACTPAYAIEELRANSGAQFDTRVVEAFERALARRGVRIEPAPAGPVDEPYGGLQPGPVFG